MAFHSLHFLLFFPLVLGLTWTLRRNLLTRNLILLVASYYFYMSFHAVYGLLIFAMTGIDFLVAGRIAESANHQTRRAWLTLSVTSNLGMLGLFKYYNFFLDNVTAATGSSAALYHSLALPLGISFFTFEALSYTIDVYRGHLVPTKSFLKFCLFISFFPRMVAGPIIRASHFLPQLELAPTFNDRAAESGLGRMLLGLFKKLCIADVLGAGIVDPIFADPSRGGWSLTLLAMYAYAFQIYYDFSGYSDVALGAARMLGFDLPENFNRPYLATSIRDFWRRWHISLSTWLRDYLYVPLGGGRGTVWSTARNLTLVMLLGGLWHGASWMFVLWGAIHGGLLAAGRLFHAATGIEADRSDQSGVTRLARIVITFHLAALCFLVFRAPDMTTLSNLLNGVWMNSASGITIPPLAYVALLGGALLEWTPRGIVSAVGETYLRLPSPLQAGVVTVGLLLFGVFGGSGNPFIYFQF